MSTKRKTGHAPRVWQPLAKGHLVPHTPEKWAALRRELATGFPHLTDDELDQQMDLARADQGREVWLNDVLVVQVDRRPDGSVQCLSIRRQDRKPLRDWRMFQRAKNELCGDEAEALELYPAESRLVDTANHYWLWVLPPGERLPVGFTGERAVIEDEMGQHGSGARQRALS